MAPKKAKKSSSPLPEIESLKVPQHAVSRSSSNASSSRNSPKSSSRRSTSQKQSRSPPTATTTPRGRRRTSSKQPASWDTQTTQARKEESKYLRVLHDIQSRTAMEERRLLRLKERARRNKQYRVMLWVTLWLVMIILFVFFLMSKGLVKF